MLPAREAQFLCPRCFTSQANFNGNGVHRLNVPFLHGTNFRALSRKSTTAIMGRTKSKNRVTPPNHLEIVEIENWREYLDWIRQDGHWNWAFRGHADANWKLETTITRELRRRNVNPKYWDDQEQRIIHVFQRKAITYLEDPPPVGDVLRWLAIMQHHGAPTRLLDFTWSPYVAAFFALESSSRDAAVWAVNAVEIGTFCSHPYGYDEMRVPFPGKVFARYAPPKSPVTIGEPFFKPRRLIAQSGTFIYPARITAPVEEALQTRPNRIAKLVLRGPKIRKEALSELYAMNVTHATLFPDLDGLARSTAYELEHHWAFDPTEGTSPQVEPAPRNSVAAGM